MVVSDDFWKNVATPAGLNAYLWIQSHFSVHQLVESVVLEITNRMILMPSVAPRQLLLLPCCALMWRQTVDRRPGQTNNGMDGVVPVEFWYNYIWWLWRHDIWFFACVSRVQYVTHLCQGIEKLNFVSTRRKLDWLLLQTLPSFQETQPEQAKVCPAPRRRPRKQPRRWRP